MKPLAVSAPLPMVADLEDVGSPGTANTADNTSTGMPTLHIDTAGIADTALVNTMLPARLGQLVCVKSGLPPTVLPWHGVRTSELQRAVSSIPLLFWYNYHAIIIPVHPFSIFTGADRPGG